MPENEELDDQSLFNDAVSDEPAETPIADVAEVTDKPEAEPARDEAGKFAKADEPEKPVEAEKPAVDDNAPMVPSWRLREINDEKRALADRLSALESERNQWLAERQRLTAKPEPEKAAKPDPLLDPEGYERYIEQKLEDKFLNNQRENSLQQAHKTYKAEFEEAYSAAQKNVDAALKARMQQSRDPGETLIQWHREQKTMREVGNDPNAWLEKKLEERLKDPAFLAKAVEQARGIAQPSSNGRPRVDLPPSLNGASRSGAALRSVEGDDLSDHELFSQTTG